MCNSYSLADMCTFDTFKRQYHLYYVIHIVMGHLANIRKASFVPITRCGYKINKYSLQKKDNKRRNDLDYKPIATVAVAPPQAS